MAVSEAPARLSLQEITRIYDGIKVVDRLSLDVEAGVVICLLGPSGCGKSTSLRIAAGVERQSSGRVLLGGRVISDEHCHAPPETRSVGLMFQEFALFPHLSVAENVAFGLGPDENRADRVRELLARVGLARFGDKYPHQLSGGEQQRVALARALAPRPHVMLMDEPFSGLDKRLRDEIRDETLAILKDEGAAVLLVTHEPEEAMRMADQIALMREGRIVQVASPYNIYNTPVDLEAAAFFSELNVISSRVHGAQTDTPFGLFLAPGHEDGAWVDIAIRPQHLRIDFDRGGQGPAPSVEHGVWARGHVTRARFMGGESLVELRMDHDGRVLKAAVSGVFLPAPGTPLWLALRRDRCFVFPGRGPRHDG
ncbi:MAG: ABC transporter ATP-binding protein [Alphaproteobacteria bacterium]|nr:MAG: ABC transporter ATP-binding protein [Alphaproteobacteria bacterium]